MQLKSSKILLLVIGLVFTSICTKATDSTAYSKIAQVFEKDSLNSIVKTLDYDKKKYKIVRKEVDLPEFWFDLPSEKLVVIVLMIILIPLIIFFLFKYKSRNNWILKPEIKEVEIEDIKKVDLLKLLNNALLEQDYRLALRYRFLIILQKLDLQKLVKWHKQKTNRNYVNEISTPLKGDFRSITTIFDRAWYGNESISVDDYSLLESRFLYFENLINEK